MMLAHAILLYVSSSSMILTDAHGKRIRPARVCAISVPHVILFCCMSL
ncbi:hypothetical protein BPSOL_0944 [Bifidobacterium pseudolongum]|nr:hypothetical protein BPSOL_0944 [Bifidobacterium pseudolongum]